MPPPSAPLPLSRQDFMLLLLAMDDEDKAWRGRDGEWHHAARVAWSECEMVPFLMAEWPGAPAGRHGEDSGVPDAPSWVRPMALPRLLRRLHSRASFEVFMELEDSFIPSTGRSTGSHRLSLPVSAFYDAMAREGRLAPRRTTQLRQLITEDTDDLQRFADAVQAVAITFAPQSIRANGETLMVSALDRELAGFLATVLAVQSHPSLPADQQPSALAEVAALINNPPRLWWRSGNEPVEVALLMVYAALANRGLLRVPALLPAS